LQVVFGTLPWEGGSRCMRSGWSRAQGEDRGCDGMNVSDYSNPMDKEKSINYVEDILPTNE